MDGKQSDKEVSDMKKHTRVILILACALSVGVLAVPSSALADGPGATKQQLLANTAGNCNQGATAGTPLDHSFVILNKADGNVSAQIHLQGAPTGGSWRIELDQRPLEGCNPIVEGIITTNKQGNGNAHVSEPILPGNTGAFVRLFPLNAEASPTGIIANTGVTF